MQESSVTGADDYNDDEKANSEPHVKTGQRHQANRANRAPLNEDHYPEEQGDTDALVHRRGEHPRRVLRQSEPRADRHDGCLAGEKRRERDEEAKKSCEVKVRCLRLRSGKFDGIGS